MVLPGASPGEGAITAERLVRRVTGITGIGSAAVASAAAFPVLRVLRQPANVGCPHPQPVEHRRGDAPHRLCSPAFVRSSETRTAHMSGWSSLVFGAGLVYVDCPFVKVSLEVGVVLGTPSGTFDPTTDGPLAHANILMHGSVTRLLTALLLTAAGYAILRTQALPRWAGQSAYLLAMLNFAFVPSLYFGIDPGRFYSALGWGNTALTAGLFTYWCAAVGVVAMIRAPKKGRAASAAG